MGTNVTQVNYPAQSFNLPQGKVWKEWEELLHVQAHLEARRRIRLLREVQKYRRALKREPEARQLEIVFPLQLNPNQYGLFEKKE